MTSVGPVFTLTPTLSRQGRGGNSHYSPGRRMDGDEGDTVVEPLTCPCYLSQKRSLLGSLLLQILSRSIGEQVAVHPLRIIEKVDADARVQKVSAQKIQSPLLVE